MRTVLVLVLAFGLSGCTRWSLDRQMDTAYRSYEAGDCAKVMLALSKAERASRARPYLQPEISLLRGQCLERQKLFVDAAQTYEFILAGYPASEYAFRARARLETLRQLGHYPSVEPAKARGAAL
ncbi:MAG TPA: tetratricopeptide repeat protein [Pseudomonas sp.]|nr:tetratricopeptide repeat protein [Pseudomonas sp.]